MKESESWHLRSIGEIPLEKVNKNLRELSTFMNANVEVIRSVFTSYHPFALVHMVAKEVAEDPAVMKQALLHYLQGRLPYAQSDGSTTLAVAQKDYKLLVNSFEELMRKSVRWVDNTALRLRSEGKIVGDDLMLAYQQEGIAFLQPQSALRVEEQISSLQYRLQPFNALIGELFGAKLDGLIAAFTTLASSMKDELSDWEVVANTDLLEADAHLLSVEMASRAWEEGSHLLIDDSGAGEPPFVRLRSVYYAFDAHRLLRDGYAIIRSAVIRQGPEYAERWLAIEATKCRLMPITFFTAMFGTMDYERDVALGESSVDALFERDEDRLLIQIPYAELVTVASPFVESEAFIELLRSALAKRRLAEEVTDPAIIVDCRDRNRYLIEGVDGILELSFGQLSTVGTSWEGIADIKDAVGLGVQLLPPEEKERDESLEATGELQSAPGSGSSYFTTFFEKETCAIEEAEEREEAEELVSAAIQPSLFDQGYSDLFDPNREPEDYSDEYESEAYEIIDPHVISDEWEADEADFSFADEEMEAGNPDGDITYYEPASDDDDADELLHLLGDHSPKELFNRLLPDAIYQIVTHANLADESRFRAFAEEGDEEQLAETGMLIEEARSAQVFDRRDKMFSVPGLDLTIVIVSSKGDAMSEWDRRSSVGAMMYLQKKEHWTMVQLEYDRTGHLSEVFEQQLSADSFSQSEWKYVMNLSQRFLERKQREQE